MRIKPGNVRPLTSAGTPLPRIQIAMFLQTVDLFTYCSAEQLMRIASIAHQRRFEPDEAIYRANDPAEALYCLFDGQVRLLSGEAPEGMIEAGQILGVRDILSDRLRGEDAVAKCGVTVLAIDADDFFDLLSNNIEIVKALFRWLLQPRVDQEAGNSRMSETFRTETSTHRIS